MVVGTMTTWQACQVRDRMLAFQDMHAWCGRSQRTEPLLLGGMDPKRRAPARCAGRPSSSSSVSAILGTTSLLMSKGPCDRILRSAAAAVLAAFSARPSSLLAAFSAFSRAALAAFSARSCSDRFHNVSTVRLSRISACLNCMPGLTIRLEVHNDKAVSAYLQKWMSAACQEQRNWAWLTRSRALRFSWPVPSYSAGDMYLQITTSHVRPSMIASEVMGHATLQWEPDRLLGDLAVLLVLLNLLPGKGQSIRKGLLLIVRDLQ